MPQARAMPPIMATHPPRASSSKVSSKINSHGLFRGLQTTENILGILQEVEKRLREEMVAIEDISRRLQPIIRTPPARSKFTWTSEEHSGVTNQNDLECGDSFLIGDSTWTKTSSGSQNSGGNSPKTCVESKARSSAAICCDGTRASLDSQIQRPLEDREPVQSGHAPFQGHRDTLNSPDVLSKKSRDTAWIIDVMRLLKDYYFKRASLRLEVEPALQNALPVSVPNAVIPVSSTDKATQTPPVICEPIHTSPCGHFQWTTSDRISPDVAFYISPFVPEDIVLV